MFGNKRKIVSEIMKFSLHHRAFYCYVGMSLWIFLLITVMYKYMSVGEEGTTLKKIVQNEYVSKSEAKFQKIHQRACNPPENIVRGTEGVVDTETWLLQGILVLTRHGDRGPLNHVKGGEKLPCDAEPNSPLLKSFEEFIANSSGSGRAYWVSGGGPFHNFPSAPRRAPGTRCALGQLTPRGAAQMITVGTILREAYGDKLTINIEGPGKKDTGEAIIYSTRYHRTFQSAVATVWGFWGSGVGPTGGASSGTNGGQNGGSTRAFDVAGGAKAGAALAAAREAHSILFCATFCACQKRATLDTKIRTQAKNRLESHPAIKDLVTKMSNLLFVSYNHIDEDVVGDVLLAYICHDAPLPCQTKEKTDKKISKTKRYRQEKRTKRHLLDVDNYPLNIELDYVKNQLDFNNEIGRKARDIIGGKYYDTKDKKAPLDFDAQMEREKLLYYQQRYIDNADAYDDVVIVKKNLDADFNFPNDRMDTDFDEDYREPTEAPEDFCIRKQHVLSLFAYLEWSDRQKIRNVHNRRRGLLLAYGLIHNIVQNMIRMISENKPKFVLYSGHDKTLQAMILALGLNNYQYYSVQCASRMIFEVYRKKDLRDEYKFTKRKAIAQDFYFRVVYNGEDITNKLSFCKNKTNVVMKSYVDPMDGMKVFNTYLCPIENIVRFIHDDYFSVFNATNFKDACASTGAPKRV